MDGAIHRATGLNLLAACRQVPEVRPAGRHEAAEALAPDTHLVRLTTLGGSRTSPITVVR